MIVFFQLFVISANLYAVVIVMAVIAKTVDPALLDHFGTERN
jgi:hypothetical protein